MNISYFLGHCVKNLFGIPPESDVRTRENLKGRGVKSGTHDWIIQSAGGFLFRLAAKRSSIFESSSSALERTMDVEATSDAGDEEVVVSPTTPVTS